MDKQELVKKILNIKNINSYLHLELEERKPLRILNNDFLSGLKHFKLNSETRLIIVDSIPKDKRNLTLEILLDSCNYDTGKFIFFSPIENAEVNGRIKHGDSSWIVEVVKDIEF